MTPIGIGMVAASVSHGASDWAVQAHVPAVGANGSFKWLVFVRRVRARLWHLPKGLGSNARLSMAARWRRRRMSTSSP